MKAEIYGNSAFAERLPAKAHFIERTFGAWYHTGNIIHEHGIFGGNQLLLEYILRYRKYLDISCLFLYKSFLQTALSMRRHMTLWCNSITPAMQFVDWEDVPLATRMKGWKQTPK